ncbi:MAG: VOC family protein [Cyclobacteriaceae bacterium]|nr:VOC family protein [Cyclobacteriaceae bacterium HetDA_MAG_MS6]
MKLRIARHTDNLEKLKAFYADILGLVETGEFQDHDGYDGVFLSRPGQGWELEFTTSNKPAHHEFDQDDLLVFYFNKRELEQLETKIELRGISKVEPKNPYWKENGMMIEDPDGYGIIVAYA